MSKKKPEPFNNPFGAVKLPAKAAPGKPAPPPPPPRPKAPPPLDAEAALFLEAVGAVAPVRASAGHAPLRRPPSIDEVRVSSDDAESHARLAELVTGDGDFEMVDSDERIEGAAPGFDVNVLRRLRAGEFSTQAQVDLHGLTREDAKLALEGFLQKSRVAGHRCVLVVTGRGLHSEDQVPVLKAGVQQWLSRGRAARQVLAFCSARPKDGGTGAVYVLLRR